jgi:hypothetical protein
MQILHDGDKVVTVATCYRALLPLGNPGYYPQEILLLSDYFDLPASWPSQRERIKDEIAKLGKYVASHFSEAEKVELNSKITEILSQWVIELEDVGFDYPCHKAKSRVSDHLHLLSGVDCYEFLGRLDTLLVDEGDPKLQPIAVYLFGPFAGARRLPNANLNIAIVSDAFAKMNLGQRKSLIQPLTYDAPRLAVIGVTFEEAENKYSLGARRLLLISRRWPGRATQWELFPERSTAAFKA